MGAVADAVSSVGDAVSDVVSSVGDVVSDVGNTVVTQVVEPVVKAVDNTVKAFEADPIGVSLKLAAAASGDPTLIFAANTSVALAHGASLDDALTSGAKAGATSFAVNGIAEAVSSPTVGSVTGPDNIDVGGGFNPATGQASPVIPVPPKLTTEGKIAGNTAGNIIRGQDPLTALMNGGISAGIPSITAQIPGYDDLTKAQQSIVNNTVSAALRGGDPSQALVDSALMAGINEAKAQYKESSPAGALPDGTQVASTDGALPTVEVSGAPIFAESSSANSVKAPFGYDLMPASMSDQKPEGSYYDQFQNAWFTPNQDAQNLQSQLQEQPTPVVTTIPETTAPEPVVADTGALPVTPTSTVATNEPTSTGALPVTTTEAPVSTDEIPEIVVTAPRDPYTGDIQLDLSGNPTTTAVTPTTTTTPASTASVGTSAPVSGLSTITTGGSNLGQTTSATPSLGALPTAPNPTMLAAAPLEKQNMILGELTNLYPQLSNIDPRLLQILSGKAKSASYYNYGAGSGGSTPLMNAGTGAAPSSGMPFKTAASSSSNTAGLTSSTGSGALSRAGLSMLDSNQAISGFAKGGLAEHNPEFITGATGHHVKGAGDGQSDSIPAMLADGEYVFDADTVAALGNGSNDAGARILDKMRQNLRKHKRSAPAGKIPPKAKSPLEYMKG